MNAAGLPSPILSAGNFTALCTRAAIEGGLTPDTACASARPAISPGCSGR